VQWHEPSAVVFGFADRDQAGVEVDVLAPERDRLADPHAGHCGTQLPPPLVTAGYPQRLWSASSHSAPIAASTERHAPAG
jgi:hypothetical protein